MDMIYRGLNTATVILLSICPSEVVENTMLNKHFLRKYIIIILLIILVCASMFLVFAAFHNTRLHFIKNTTQVQHSLSSLLKALIFYTCASISLFTALIFIAINLYRKNMTFKAEKEQFIRTYDREIEKQNILINNLTALYNEALEHENLKTEFFSNISHDLKTPLTVILGAIQLIEQKNSSEEPELRKITRHLHTIKHHSYRLLRLLNNILDITKLDSGYAKVNMVNCNIVYLIEEITQSVSPFAEQKSLTLEFDTESEEIITAVDVEKIERVILNLLSNAIKFSSPKGKIWINVCRRNSMVQISVKDTGPGIPPEMQDTIFDRYRQVSSSLTRDYEGNGIGLSVVKSFIDLHSGSIHVESHPGKGSEFIVQLPIQPCEAGKELCSNTCEVQGKISDAINIELSSMDSAV